MPDELVISPDGDRWRWEVKDGPQCIRAASLQSFATEWECREDAKREGFGPDAKPPVYNN